MKPLAKIGNDLSRAMIEITKTSAEIETQGHDVAKRIENSFEELHAILERRKNLLLEEVRDKVKQKTKNLKEQNKSLSTASSNVRSVIDYTQQCVQYCSDSDIMEMHDDIAARIKQEIDDHNTPKRKINPLEEVDIDMEVECADPLQELCRTNVRLTQIPVVIKFQNEYIFGIVNVTSEFHVSVTLANGGQLKGDPDVSSELKQHSVYGHERPNTVTQKTKHGEYNIAFTPCSSGDHHLSVTVNSNGVQFSTSVTVQSLAPPAEDWSVRDGNNIPMGSEDNIPMGSEDNIPIAYEAIEYEAIEYEGNHYCLGPVWTSTSHSNHYCVEPAWTSPPDS